MDRVDLLVRPGCYFDDVSGKLYHNDGEMLAVFFPWPQVVAYRKHVLDDDWKAWQPSIRFRPEQGANTFRTPSGPDANGGDGNAARYWSLVPERVRELVAGFPERQWQLLGWMARTGEAAQDLAISNPALAFALACYRDFRPRGGEGAVARFAPPLLVYQKQREIQGWLGFPRLESVRKILQKITHRAIQVQRLQQLRAPLANADVRQRLGHVPRINAEILPMACDTSLLHVTPRLLSDLSAEAHDQLAAPVAALLRDTLRMWRMVHPRQPPPTFRRVERIRQVHDGLAEAMNQAGVEEAAAPLPASPFVGTDTIVPLTTRLELLREGQMMHNCVASYARSVAAGSRVIYRVLAPERATLSLTRRRGGWRLEQLKGFCNRPVSTKTRKAVLEWLKANRFKLRHCAVGLPLP